ncbi:MULTISPECIES: hypothetical protein [unclassified Empedobacter]|jgi:uncharacterized membrane protein|uniref:hypothetical protein n=1 Tax=unclassified Empedobacter TaxID=2643773 RepID=UPI00050A0744|nr:MULTISPECIES: hypothetical protein [unclassified Empedobacter]MBX2904184.1 hypothetical protein [Chitinophagales bacterium]
MNGAHWHLVVNHLPIIFPIVGVIVMITGLISKSEAVKRTAFMIFVFGALAAIAAMNTGEGAEEVVENINGVSENFIESHEEAAETFAILSYILGGISLLGLWASFKQKSFSSIISIATLIFAFVVLFFAKQTGTTGGEIRHTEIRSGNNIPASENKNAEEDQDD